MSDLDLLLQSLGVQTTEYNLKVVADSQLVVLAVKPHVITPVLKEVCSSFSRDKLMVSIAAGIPISTLEKVRFMCYDLIYMRIVLRATSDSKGVTVKSFGLFCKFTLYKGLDLTHFPTKSTKLNDFTVA